MKNNNILINASNLHNGGGIQVATSFIFELFSLNIQDLNIDIYISDEVAENLIKSGIDVNTKHLFKIINTYGLNAYTSCLNDELLKYDLVFFIFGPNYLKRSGYIDLVGFAQAWILDGSVYNVLSPLNRVKSKLKFLIQEWFFKRSDALVVELEHVRDGIYQKGIASPGNVYVSHNCISSLYFDRSLWDSAEVSTQSSKFKIGFLGRDYPHKNTKIIPQVKRILYESYGFDVDFYVTFNETEWAAKNLEFKESVNNVGILRVTQCPKFYQTMDAVIFPSLLECFSATPLEAMVMEKPLFASDKCFVRDICDTHAIYFDPLDASDVAHTIANYIQHNHGKDSARLTEAREHAVNFSSARGRAERYLEIIRSLLAQKGCL